MRLSAWILGGLSLFAVAHTVIIGPWRITIGGGHRMTSILRALIVCAICRDASCSGRCRASGGARRRSLWLFYAGATIAMAI
jgi:hypothetical protein